MRVELHEEARRGEAVLTICRLWFRNLLPDARHPRRSSSSALIEVEEEQVEPRDSDCVLSSKTLISKCGVLLARSFARSFLLILLIPLQLLLGDETLGGEKVEHVHRFFVDNPEEK